MPYIPKDDSGDPLENAGFALAGLAMFALPIVIIALVVLALLG